MSNMQFNPKVDNTGEPAKNLVGNSVSLFADQKNIILYMNNLLENMSDAFIATNVDFKIVQWNKAAELVYGWKADEVMGRSILDLITTEYVNSAREQALQKVMTEGVWSGKVVQTCKDGRSVIIHSTVSLMKDEAGNVIGLAAVNREDTDAKQAEERFRLAVESAPNAIIMIDPQGKIVLVNSQTEKYFGYLRDELTGASVERLVPTRFKDVHSGHREKFETSPQIRAMGVGRELYALRKNGSEFPVEIGLAPIMMQEGTFILATIVDITERKLAEEETHRLNKELEAFSYSVSHDLRAPLRSIDGFSSALVNKYSAILDESGLHYLTRIRANVGRMGKMIDDLLLLAKMTRHELKLKTVDLSTMVKDILEELMAQDTERKVRFEIGEQIEAECDAGLIQNVLLNLLENAWKFTSKQSDALIQFGLSENKRFGRSIYFVRDTGVGFEMDHADKLFNTFQRLHTEDEFPGSGIGLAIVQRIIHRHGGRIWAEAAPDKGATFFFTLGG